VADGRETLPHDRKLGALDNDNASPEVQEFGACNNVQNFERFYTTSD